MTKKHILSRIHAALATVNAEISEHAASGGIKPIHGH